MHKIVKDKANRVPNSLVRDINHNSDIWICRHEAVNKHLAFLSVYNSLVDENEHPVTGS